MTITAHRLSKTRFASADLEALGIGAALLGGRWNSQEELRDRRVIYTSSHLALACLEVLVHVGGNAMRGEPYSHLTFDLHADFTTELPITEVGRDWRTFSETPQSQQIGDEWYDTKASPILRVPSILMPDALYSPSNCNYLINARHPDITRAVTLTSISPFAVDDRLR